jgi:hypothetical protein
MLAPSTESVGVRRLGTGARPRVGFMFERVVRRCLYAMRFLVLAPNRAPVGLRAAPHGYVFKPNYAPECEPLDWWSLVPRRQSGCTCSFCISSAVVR